MVAASEKTRRTLRAFELTVFNGTREKGFFLLAQAHYRNRERTPKDAFLQQSFQKGEKRSFFEGSLRATPYSPPG